MMLLNPHDWPLAKIMTLLSVSIACLVSPLVMADSILDLDECRRIETLKDPVIATPVKEAAKEASTTYLPLFEKDQTEVKFRLKTADGAPPKIVLFNKTFKMRKMALNINRLRGKPAEENFTATWEGLVFNWVPNTPDEVSVTLVGRTEEHPLPNPISKQKLEKGEVITIDLPKVQKSRAGSEVIANGRLKIQYSPETTELRILEASGSLSIHVPVLGTSEDQASVEGTGKKDPALERKPTAPAE